MLLLSDLLGIHPGCTQIGLPGDRVTCRVLLGRTRGVVPWPASFVGKLLYVAQRYKVGPGCRWHW